MKNYTIKNTFVCQPVNYGLYVLTNSKMEFITSIKVRWNIKDIHKRLVKKANTHFMVKLKEIKK